MWVRMFETQRQSGIMNKLETQKNCTSQPSRKELREQSTDIEMDM